jgi:hypothetical protein
MSNSDENSLPPPEQSMVLSPRDYADIVHLENPSFVERMLSTSRAEATSYVGALLSSGLPRYIVAGPKVAFTAAIVQVLGDFWREVCDWRKTGRIPEDFTGRPFAYQTWVELLKEIDSDPVDAERLKAMKAMFLAASKVGTADGEAIVAYQLFQIAKTLRSGELFLMKASFSWCKSGSRNEFVDPQQWFQLISETMGHNLHALIIKDETVLVDKGLLAGRTPTNKIPTLNGRLTDLGLRFCKNVEAYNLDSTK